MDSIIDFKAYLMEKMQALVGVHYQLHSNNSDYLNTLWTNQIFFDPKSDEVYDRMTNILQLILLMLSNQKLHNLEHL